MILSKSKKLRICLVLILLNVSYSSFADDDLPPTDDPPVPSAPIDNGLIFLIIAGLIIAGKVIYFNNQRRLLKNLDSNNINE